MSEDARPDPDALLKRVQREEEQQHRARLKIFFGFAPGVGKTYAMLEAAKRSRRDGADVVVGVLETHGRKETAALLEGLPAVPLRAVEYRGKKIAELDLDAAIARRPGVLLVDELAHTNAPGSRHPKRFQDVLELLDAGIDVHTTLNVQHVESLNDVVAQITGVRVRETVPDVVLDRADEIELVDVPPEELLARLRDGKVYLGEQAERAASRFFQQGNLLALRELALRRTADRVDIDVKAYREAHAIEKAWATSERILVCVGPAPASARLVRAARRMAAGLRASWVAAHVEPAGSLPLSATDRESLEANLKLAESMGAECVRLTGPRVSDAILDYARKSHVTRIVIGKPTHARLRDLMRGSLLDEVVRGSGDIDVHVIRGDEGAARPAATRTATFAGPLREHAAATALVGLVTAAGAALRDRVSLPDMVTLYVLAIMIVASRWGRPAALLASFLSVAAYDFFFVPPFHTFAVSDVRHALTFAMMFAVGVIISGLVDRMRRGERWALAREARTASLYELSRSLVVTLDPDEAARTLAKHVSDLIRGGAAVLVPRDERLELASVVGDIAIGPADLGVARWAYEHGSAAGRDTDTLPGSAVTCVPMRLGSRVLGVLTFRVEAHGEDKRPVVTRELMELVTTFAAQGALVLERARLADEAKSSALRARTEELRSSLLSAVSHDLRTPLAVIKGSASALREGTPLDEEQKQEMIATVCDEAERLERLVTNLLDMTRLEAGVLEVRREWVPLEEIVGSALARLEKKLGAREVLVGLRGAPLVSVDPILFEQVFVNLLHNACKYTPEASPIEILGWADERSWHAEVLDRGPGIEESLREVIFEKFERGGQRGGEGAGLGLAICRGIVAAHGGALVVTAREGGGARFVMDLPLPSGAPTVEVEA